MERQHSELIKLNEQLCNTGLKSANDFLYAFLDSEDKIIQCLQQIKGINSEIYLRTVDDSLTDVIKFSAIFSDLTLLNTTTSTTEESHFTYFEPPSPYWRDRMVTVPPQLVSEIGTDPNRFLLCYINRNDKEINKLFANYKPMLIHGKLMIRPLRGMYLMKPIGVPGILYYVNPNTPNDHWFINDIKKDYIIIDNGVYDNNQVKLFSIVVPYLENIDIEELSKILQDETDILSTFRTNLKKLVNESGDNIDQLSTITNDLIRPSIDTIERKFKRIVNAHRLTVRASVGTFTLSLIIASINNSLLQTLTGAVPLATLILSENTYQEKLDTLKDNPYYLLWKIEHVARHTKP